jgi:hypothetical protein
MDERKKKREGERGRGGERGWTKRVVVVRRKGERDESWTGRATRRKTTHQPPTQRRLLRLD